MFTTPSHISFHHHLFPLYLFLPPLNSPFPLTITLLLSVSMSLLSSSFFLCLIPSPFSWPCSWPLFPRWKFCKGFKIIYKNWYGRKIYIYRKLNFWLYIHFIILMAHFVNIELEVNATFLFFKHVLTCVHMHMEWTVSFMVWGLKEVIN